MRNQRSACKAGGNAVDCVLEPSYNIVKDSCMDLSLMKAYTQQVGRTIELTMLSRWSSKSESCEGKCEDGFDKHHCVRSDSECRRDREDDAVERR